MHEVCTTPSFILSPSLSLPFIHAHSLTLSHFLSLSHTHTHTHIHEYSLSLTYFLMPPFFLIFRSALFSPLLLPMSPHIPPFLQFFCSPYFAVFATTWMLLTYICSALKTNPPFIFCRPPVQQICACLFRLHRVEKGSMFDWARFLSLKQFEFRALYLSDQSPLN